MGSGTTTRQTHWPAAPPAAALLMAAVAAAPSAASADAYETSVHIEAVAGTAKLGDPLASGTSSVGFAGGAARFTWATRHWLAWEVETYGVFAGSVSHEAAVIDGRMSDFGRGAVAIGADAGVSLRLGVRLIPTISVGIGPQLRLYPSTALIESGSGFELGASGVSRVFDLAGRVGVGVDYRFNRRLVVGFRAGARAAAGLGGGAWRALEGMIHVGLYWYPRWWLQ